MHDRCLQKLLFRFMILLQIQPLSPLLPLPYFFFFSFTRSLQGKQALVYPGVSAMFTFILK